MKNTHKINIAGVEMMLNSENGEEYVQKLAAELTRRISTIALSAAGRHFHASAAEKCKF